MKAAVVHDFTKPLTVEQVPKPVPGRGEVLVKIETAGLCHTDIHAAHGDWPVKPTPPFIPGHEGVGIVEQVGEGVDTPKVGDRVAMPWLGAACGVCQYCVDGWETLCEEQINTGYGTDGSYAEYATANAAFVAQVPDAVDPLDASVLTCAELTTYKAVRLAGARPGSLVAIFGIGGLGHLAVQYAKISGASVVAVDITDDKLQLAKDLGARCRQRVDRGPGQGHPGDWRRPRGHRRGGGPEGLRTGLQLAAPWRNPDLRRAARR